MNMIKDYEGPCEAISWLQEFKLRLQASKWFADKGNKDYIIKNITELQTCLGDAYITWRK